MQALMKAPILVPPVEREPLLLYITATMQAVSAALVVEREVAACSQFVTPYLFHQRGLG
jgi:hypothetical protein